ncbi:hypothetical protein JTB14_029781 [Gonioctena quinquepunctata]|nr:hypothetical protein JTB14_029781 [Gonioctena quinquepunctata]
MSTNLVVFVASWKLPSHLLVENGTQSNLTLDEQFGVSNDHCMTSQVARIIYETKEVYHRKQNTVMISLDMEKLSILFGWMGYLHALTYGSDYPVNQAIRGQSKYVIQYFEENESEVNPTETELLNFEIQSSNNEIFRKLAAMKNIYW